MCYDDNARPPIAEGAEGSASGEDIVLTAEDGTQFAAYFARPHDPAGAQVIIYPDIRGLHQFYKELALRFAETGVAALALDYFGRTAGLTARDESFEFRPHVQQLQLPNILQDVQAALAYLRSHASADAATFPVGFCLGGSLSLISGTNKDYGFAGLIAFYAGMKRDFDGTGTVLDRAADIAYPVLGLFGGADASIPIDSVKALESKLTQNGLENLIIIYEDAPHGFFDRQLPEFADASADAWERIQDFIAEHK